MKKWLLTFLVLWITKQNFAQKWVDTLYQIQEVNSIVYGSAITYAGNTQALELNLAMPTNDTPPACGRPLMLLIHGGAFLAGSKNTDAPPQLLRDFAKRGFVTASIDYRLGMFQTSSPINCNVSWMLGSPWNCLNMQDTAEWYRAAYRGMQDAKGAIRYLVQHAANYNIDPKNVFVVGESAGGFIALETAFLDDNSEKPTQVSSLPNAIAPNAIYESQCITTPGFASSIAAMQLQRPDLGSIDGDLNPGGPKYSIKGVGNLYGGMMFNLFAAAPASSTTMPRLFLFHQPNDLIVPYDQQRVLEGMTYCYTQWPTNCQWIINRPQTYGSKGIATILNGMISGPVPIPSYYLDTTTNFADCAAQIANPNVAGHALDNYWLRTNRMAEYFAPAIDTSACVTSLNSFSKENSISLYPNPTSTQECHLSSRFPIVAIQCRDMQGKSIPVTYKETEQLISLPNLELGIYILQVFTQQGVSAIKLYLH
ncbi:MAG TPA: alpha/beta hydrolase fold domain-containing protein [Chitinophagaceae bacterium]|nr:alpha/beta hydrolase fold domain-containing protein [Chitinophagaceae bacterium]